MFNFKIDSSGPVDNFSLIENNIDPNIEYNNTIAVNWLFPCNANGEITEFVIFFNHDNLSEIEIVPISFNNTQMNFTHSLELNPDTQYHIWVTARSDIFDGQNFTSEKFTLTPGSKV
jgi:Fibronectin type III domain